MNAPWSDGERPPSGWRHIWGRFGIAAVLIIAITGGATAVATLNKASTIAHNLFPVTHEIHTRKGVVAAAVYSGKPETFLLIGSDRRALSKNAGERESARSDTMMLVHLDPQQGQTSVLSIPRDLLVHIRTRSGQVYYPEKINAAYTIGSEEKSANGGGGAALVAETIEKLFEEATGHPFELAGLVDVSFRGFIRVVDSLGCVYVNVDHRYYNRNEGTPETDYSNINLHPGYHRLCNEKALSYVRYRHTDSDFVRVARQQDFIRSLREQVPVSNVIGEIERVSKSVGKAILSTFTPSQTELIELGKLVGFSQEKPLRQIRFQTSDDAYMMKNANGEEGSYVTSTPQLIRATLAKFLHSQRHAQLPSEEARSAGKPARPGSHGKGKAQGHQRRPRRPHRRSPAELHLDATTQPGEVLSEAPSLPFPLKYPHLKTDMATPLEVDNYRVSDRQHKRFKAFVEVFQQNEDGGYYDVEGMNWLDPPIVARPNAHRTMDGRRYSIFEDGEHVHVIAWREDGALYWVNNTLLDELGPAQMFAIANSVRDPH